MGVVEEEVVNLGEGTRWASRGVHVSLRQLDSSGTLRTSREGQGLAEIPDAVKRRCLESDDCAGLRLGCQPIVERLVGRAGRQVDVVLAEPVIGGNESLTELVLRIGEDLKRRGYV